jgi:alpha-L-rhamnosidase
VPQQSRAMFDSDRSIKSYSRRQFITRTGLAGLAASWTGRQVVPEEREADDADARVGNGWENLRTVFLQPPESARPMTRWWWFGGAITPEEITRELTLMREAGIGGVELQPVYPLEVDDPQRGIRNTRYFSEEFNELLRHTVRETRRLGLQFDLTLGSGWPYGGPFIPVNRAARRLRVLTRNVAGPRQFSWDLKAEIQEDENIIAAVATPVLPSGELDLTHSRVITDRILAQTENREITFRGFDQAELPSGLWSVQVFVDAPTLMQVKRPTLGMEGYVIDHHSQEAMALFLDAAGNQVIDQLKSVADPPFHSAFCDSLEVYGADWTTHFMAEFQRRRGYDFKPYLPALCQDAGPLNPHLRYDYHLTMSDLIVEYFFQRLARWAREHGLTARIQAHGAFGDVMQGYASADIPEGEDIFHGTHYSVNIKHRRLCTSAAHIYQKRLASAETYTWLDMPLFTVTLEEMKAATDTMFLDGINHIVNSGYPSSPPQTGRPGWVFYAETIVNHNNIWWPHYRYLAEYVQRVQSLLTQGVAVNQVAVYIPLPDVYAQFGKGSLNMDEEIEKRLGLEPFLALRRAGYDFDLINDSALETVALVKGGKLLAGDAVYSAAIVFGAHFMPPESLERLAEFVRDGGLLIFVGRLPEAAPGMADQEQRTTRVRSLVAALWPNRQPVAGRMETVGKGKSVFVADYSSALSQLELVVPPDFRVLGANDGSEAALRFAQSNVGFAHRRVGPVEIYFVSNVAERSHRLRVQFAAGGRQPQLWDADNREIYETMVFRPVDLSGGVRGTEALLHLDPFASCFVVFAPSDGQPIATDTNWPGPLRLRKAANEVEASGLIAANGHYYLVRADGTRHDFTVNDVPQPVAIEGTWDLELDDSPKLRVAGLRSWNDLASARNYSGWATYSISFDVPDLGRDLEWWLDLGSVHETAEASLNGTALGAAWKGVRRLACRQALKAGRNQLAVKVGNLWVNNYYSRPKRDLKPVAETFGIRWGTYGEIPPKTMPPSGLLGPVRLIPLQRRTEKL